VTRSPRAARRPPCAWPRPISCPQRRTCWRTTARSQALRPRARRSAKEVNARVHRTTRRIPDEMLAEEHTALHALPARAFTACFGVTRTVGTITPVVSFRSQQLLGAERASRRGRLGACLRRGGDRHRGLRLRARGGGPPPPLSSGQPQYLDEHFGPAPEGPLHRSPKAKTKAEADFLAIGDGAALWLIEAGAAGTVRPRVKMANAVSLAALHGSEAVDRALAEAAVLGPFRRRRPHLHRGLSGWWAQH